MSRSRRRGGITAAVIVGSLTVMLAQVAWAHVHVTCNPSQNKIMIKWRLPCANPPQSGKETEVTQGDPPGSPPPDAARLVVEGDGMGNTVVVYGACNSGEAVESATTAGCGEAGGLGTATLADQPSASVGLITPDGQVVPGSEVRAHVERIVTPGIVPDIVRVTILSGVLRTRASGNDQAFATLKLIVYPDTNAANADIDQSEGIGSNFFGAVTLVGASGSLVPSEGFLASDFVALNDGNGQFSATPVAGLTKVALVPDADAAVVSVVGDPRSTPSGTTGIQDPVAASGLWLGGAIPNPARAEARIPFALQRGGWVSLAIFDQQGRRVRELVGQNLEAGQHEARWDGRDAGGRLAPNALYFYRLQIDGKKLTGKLFTIR
jgi:hypothetical protein